MAEKPGNKVSTVRSVRNHLRSHPVIYSFLVFLLLCFVLWQISLVYEDNLINKERSATDERTIIYRNSLESAFQKRFIIFTSVVTHVRSSIHEGNDTDFTLFLKDIYPSAMGIRNIGIAPGGIQTYVYPPENNQVVPGHDLINDTRPEVQKDVRLALDTGEIIISGPYELRQGGQGLILRKAVYQNGKFWGLATMALDLPRLLDEASGSSDIQGIIFAIRDSDNRVFYGDQIVFDNNPVIRRAEIHNEFWEIAAIPGGGWHASVKDSIFVFRAAGLVIVTLVTLLLFFAISSHAILAKTVKERTRELEREKKTLSRINRALKVISEINGILVRTINEQELMKKICSTLVTTGNYPLVIIGRYRHEESEQSLIPVVSASSVDILEPEIYGRKNVLLDEAVLAGKTQLSGGPLVEKCDMADDGRDTTKFCPFCPGCRAIIAFPLHTDDDPPLVLIIYSSDEDSFDAEEIALLDQMTEDMTFGIRSIRTWNAREAAEQDLVIKGYALNSSVNGISLADLSGKVRYANKAFLQMFGYQREEEMIGRPIDFFAHDSQREEEKILLIMDAVKTKGGWIGEVNPVRKDGTSFSAQLSVSMVRDKDGKPAYMMASFIDITQMKAAFEKIAFQAGVLDVVSEAIISVDPDYRITSWNPMAESLFGWSSQEVIGRVTTDILKTEFIGVDRLEHYRVSRENGMYHGRAIQYTKEGKPVHVSLSTIAMKDEQGRLTGYVKVLHDITDLVGLEEIRREAFTQIEKNFAELAILNDQIRNPLSVIVGLADLDQTGVNKKILEQALEIDKIIARLDRGWVESGKVREFLRKHYGIVPGEVDGKNRNRE